MWRKSFFGKKTLIFTIVYVHVNHKFMLRAMQEVRCVMSSQEEVNITSR